MPSLSEAVGTDLSGYKPVEPGVAQPMPPPSSTPSYVNPMMRCPLPPIWQTSPDSLRQFTNNGVVPQNRLFTPSQITVRSGNTTLNQFVSASSASTGNGGSTGGGGVAPSTSKVGIASQTSVVTGVLSPGGIFRGVLQCAKAFQLLNASATQACRIQMYGTALSQLIDLSRPLDVSPPAGSSQGIICDLALDTNPFMWSFQDRVGANADNPQASLVYITITNLTAGSTALTVTVKFITLED